MTAQVVATVVYIFYPMFDRFEVLVGLSFALGLGLGVSQPMVLSLMHRVTPPGRIGEAAGLRLMIVNGTQTVLPSVFGVLGSAFGVGLLFWTVGSMVGLACSTSCGLATMTAMDDTDAMSATMRSPSTAPSTRAA